MSSVPLGDVVATLARVDVVHDGLANVLELVAELAKQLLSADEVSLTVLHGEEPTTVAATGVLARAVDMHQYASGQGPCLEVARSGGVVVAPDLTRETRWPRFTAHAVREGAHSAVAVGLPLLRPEHVAINLYSTRGHAFDEQDAALAAWLADYAAVAISNVTRYTEATALVAQMRDAMASRATIEQAKGILMASYDCDAESAFQHLVERSQAGQRKLRDVAAEIVDRRRDLTHY